MSGDTWVTPCLRVLPRGCSWAVYWCQEADLAILQRAGAVRAGDGLVDVRPLVRLETAPLHTVYLDNIVFFGLDPQQATAARRAASGALAAASLPVHEEEEDGLAIAEVLAIAGLLKRRRVLPPEVVLVHGDKSLCVRHQQLRVGGTRE